MKPAAEPAALEAAADLLRRAKRPVCLVGRGAVWSDASPSLLRLCEPLTRLVVVSTPGAKGVFPENHGRYRGVFGFSGHATAKQAVADADALLIVGSRLLEQSSGGFHPRLREPGVVRIDHDAKHASRLAGQIFLAGDARLVLEQLTARLEPVHLAGAPPPADLTAAIPIYPGPFALDRHVKPQALIGAISRLGANVPVTADAGNSMCWAIEWLERIRPRDFQVSLDWGSMGFALPAAIGISLARGHAPAIALTGDGAMAMFGGDLHTAVELEIPLIVIVLNDGGAGMVRAGCEAWFGPEAVPDVDYRYKLNLFQYARALGAHADMATDLESFEHALRGALARATPTLIDVHIDPSEAPAAILERVQGLAGDAAGREGGGMC
ncbi:MAG TPA: thiamine pyrophosphate-dependent enzyme [Polyangiaceae bacterium]|nr:thiamine pyrophosphate-dependent enzyme [Polyangiaceae bacterium]